MTLTIVPIRAPDAVLVNDIPGQLRQLADQIESGEVEAASMLAIIPNEGDWPTLYGWGEDLGEYGRIGVLDVMRAWLVGRKVAR